MNTHSMTAEERFWHYVRKGSPTECWLWKGQRLKSGYGAIRVGNKMIRAHRFSFQIANGRTPLLHVLHKCDNPLCVNPAHLWEGTHLENMHDMYAKGRRRLPHRNHNAKLTDEQIVEIRRTWNPKQHRLSEFADKYGVHLGTISRIVRGQAYKNAGEILK
jgi:hypothetical protein